MKLSSYTKEQLRQHLATDGLVVTTGPVTVHLKTRLNAIIDHLYEFYSHYPVSENAGFADFHVRIDYPANIRRWIKSQVYFYLDGRVPFKPLPASQASPMLEWGLNWCIANHSHQFLIMHAAALEKNGCGLLLPAEPGSGKSTLTAALIAKGWRLLSDELGIISLSDGRFIPLSRPVNLKNESIEIIRQFSPEAIISKPYKDTNKGTVALVAAPENSIRNANRSVEPKWIIQPTYLAGSKAKLTDVSKGQMFMHLAHNSFNYSLLAEQGFMALEQLVEQCECFSFCYSRLEDAIEIFDKLADSIDV